MSTARGGLVGEAISAFPAAVTLSAVHAQLGRLTESASGRGPEQRVLDDAWEALTVDCAAVGRDGGCAASGAGCGGFSGICVSSTGGPPWRILGHGP